MTGNTARFGEYIVNGKWDQAARYGWAVLFFVAGLLVSASLTQAERRSGVRSAFAIVLGLECVLLALFIFVGRISSFSATLATLLPCAAMGLQTVTITRVGPLRVYTTYMTGNLSKFAEGLTNYLFWLRDRTRGRFRRRIGKALRITPRQKPVQEFVVTAGLWVAFLAGVLAGSSSIQAWGRPAVAMPMAVLAAAAAADLWAPVAFGEPSDDELPLRAK